MASGSDQVETLGSVPLFSGLSKRQLRKVAELGSAVDHPAEHVITREGATGHGFHVVLDGRVDVSVSGESKAELGRGAYFGEMALLDGGPRTATITASGPVRTLVIEATAFRRLVESDSALAYQLLVVLSQRVREAEGSPQA